MPVYDYVCKNCESKFTKSLSIVERELPLSEACPECHKTGCVEKTIESASAFVYNPSGQLKMTDSFNDRLIEIKKTKPKENTINTR